MMDFTWYILGVLTGGVAYSLYLISKKTTLNWLFWSGLIVGSSLILFCIACVVGSVLEGVPRAASMGILLFGLSGVIILTLTARLIASQKDRTEYKKVPKVAKVKASLRSIFDIK